MARPPNLKKWATDENSLVVEPSNSFKRLGFLVSSPAVNFFNWLYKRLFDWIDFFENGSRNSSFIYHQYRSARPNVELPFALPATNKLQALEVLKRTEESVGGVSETNYSGSGSVTAATSTEGRAGRLTYTASQTGSSLNGVVSDSPWSYGQGIASVEADRDDGVSAHVFGPSVSPSSRRNTNPTPALLVSRRRRHYMYPVSLRVETSTGNMLLLNFRLWREGGWQDSSDRRDTRSVREALGSALLTRERPYLVIGENLSEIARANCILWRVQSSDYSGLFYETEASNVAPIHKGVDVSTRLTFMKLLNSYQLTVSTPSSQSGSSLATQIALNNSSPFNQESYAYDPAADTIKIKLSGTVSATAFHTLNIIKDGTTVLSLLASNATYDATEKTFTWTSSNDPLSAGGTTTFSYFLPGSGLNVYSFVVVTSGLSVTTQGNKDYLRISSGFSNNDVLLVRRKQVTT